MEMLEWLRAGSDDHAVRDGNGVNFSILPKSDSEEDRRAFQSAAQEALAEAGGAYAAMPHRTSEWGLPDWDGPVYDLVVIMPTK